MMNTVHLLELVNLDVQTQITVVNVEHAKIINVLNQIVAQIQIVVQVSIALTVVLV